MISSLDIIMKQLFAAAFALSLACVFPALAEPATRPLIRDFVGLNADFNFRPDLYATVCRLVRNYHNIAWDVNRPGDPLTFPRCVNGVDWDLHVYTPWKKRRFEIDLCAQIDQFGPAQSDYKKLWDGQEKWCRQYGYEMAKYFGPSGAHKLVTSIEIGNEPGKNFDDGLYRQLFKAMAQGIRAGDPKVRIVTAAARPGTADEWVKSFDETYAARDLLPLYDVINLHDYASKEAGKGQSPWDRSYPEDQQIRYLREIDDAIRWRNEHAPGKKIWLTEFGYDACSPEAMQHRDGWFERLNWRGQTDLEQAQFLVRSLLNFSERDLDRAYIYFYNDNDQAAVHGASGLTRKFEPKPSYWAVRHYSRVLGNYRFARVIECRPGELVVFEFKHQSRPDRIVWVVWSPTGDNRPRKVELANLPEIPQKAEKMPTKDGTAERANWQSMRDKSIQLEIDGSPIYLMFGDGNS